MTSSLNRAPAIACIAVIGKQNNPLLMSLFPSEHRDPLEFSFLLSSCLDIFEVRAPHKIADQDFGLLQAVDEKIALYGWLTNSGIKFVIAVDMAGRILPDSKQPTILGFRDSELKPAFRALQNAYINLLRNPFYMPDEPTPQGLDVRIPSAQITSPSFLREVKRIASSWTPGVNNLS